MSVNLNKMPTLFDDDVPFTYPDGSHIPVGLAFLLATQEHITLSEARLRMIDTWRGGKGNRAQRRQRKKKCRQ